jgi:hypothetical protein
MRFTRLTIGVLGLAVLVTFACTSASRANAKGLLAHTVSLAKATAEGCATPAPVANCCPQPCITYRHRGPKLCCDNCQPPVETVLRVKDPCTCCEVDVTVCMPACCTGDPKICFDRGFLGRNVVEYEWCCGYSVRVAFKHNGDLLVTTWGR